MSRIDPSRIVSPSRLSQMLARHADRAAVRRGQSSIDKGIIPAAYVSGNPTAQLGYQTSVTASTKTNRVQAPFSNRFGAPVASENIASLRDAGGNPYLSRVTDLSQVIVDADYIMGLRPVTPGNTTLLTDATALNGTDSTYVIKYHFQVLRPGRYRVTVDASRSGGTTQTKLQLLRRDGTYADASTVASYSGTVNPTFGTLTMDMNITAEFGAFIVIAVLNTLGPSQTWYLQNAVLKYADASASLSSYDVVL